MKKKSFLLPTFLGKGSKFFAIVCLVSMLSVVSASSIFASNYAQDKKISLNLKNASITDVFKAIQAKTEFDFFYKNEQIPKGKNVNINVQDVSINEVLDRVLKDSNLAYKLMDTDIVISPIQSIQKEGKISGTVVDAEGIPLPGVSIRIEGTTIGTVTDFDGKYSLHSVHNEETLIFSFIGMTTQKLPVSSAKSFDIVLQSDTQGLEEVVVVGYGAMKRKQITSSVATLDTEELQDGATTTPIQLLQGKVAGLAISRPNGSDPNSSPQIMLRGASSINGGTTPLIIVNGVEVGSLDIVSPEDIESFSVLKDGSAAAIYGSRGTNGVILITTKQGKEAKATVEYSGYYSFDQLSKRPDILTADEFRALATKRDIKVGDASTDWYDELLQTSSNMVHNIAISGGSTNTNYRASIEYADNKGIALESFKQRVNGRVNINHKAIDNRLSVKVDLSANQSKYRIADYGAFGTALTMDPTQPVYNEDGTFKRFPDFGKNNPIAAIKQSTQDNTHKILLANIYSDFRILDGLKVGGRVAWKMEDWNTGSYESRYSEGSIENDYQGMASRGANFSYRTNYELNANYRKQFGKHEISAMVNWSKESDTYETMSMWNKGFATDAFLYNSIESGSWLKDEEQTPGMNTFKKKNELESYRARLVYTFDEKYMFTASFNREGSSIFGANYKWGNFKGISAGWTISNESFMQSIGGINYLKLRVGYGETGNSGAAEYQSLARIGQEGLSYLFRGQTIVAYGLKGNPNPNLKWEEKAETNFGLDYAILDNTFEGSLDFYQRKTTDLLYRIDAPLPSNLNPTTLMNVGEIYNHGIELTVNAKIVNTNDFKWNASFNCSFNTNEVKDLSIGVENSPQYFKQLPAPGNLGTVYRVEEGQPLGNFYAKRFVDIDENGKWVFKDLNEDGAIKDEDDREIVGNGTPKYFAGLTNNFQYKNFNLSLFFRGAFDYQILNVGRMYYENINKFPASNIYATTGRNGLTENSQYSDYYLENGDYIKLENISLSYDFNVSKIKFLSAARMYVSCNNVFTITDYSGLSPEVSITGLESAGYDGMNFYPITRTFTIGASIKF